MGYRQILIPRFALIDQSKAITLNPTRSATQRLSNADLIGDALPDDTTDRVVVCQFIDNTTANPPEDTCGGLLAVEGDITARYPNAANTYTLNMGPMSATLGTISTQGSIGRGPCGGFFSTHTRFLPVSTQPIAECQSSGSVQVSVSDAGGIIDFWASIPFCGELNPGPPDPGLFFFKDPTT